MKVITFIQNTELYVQHNYYKTNYIVNEQPVVFV